MSSRRSHSSKGVDEKPSSNGNGSLDDAKKNSHEHKHSEHDHDHEHEHTHSHSIFGHSHGEDGHSHDAEKIVEALQGSGDRGSRITLIGLFANVGLTALKATAGWYMHSAALFADAGHSLSDLLGDFVTLICWKLSRKPPSELYPFGFAKFETLGTTTISLLLVGGALGIGFHSYHLLIETLQATASTLPSGALQGVIQNVTSAAPQVPVIGHAHSHTLDPNAAWFAAISVVGKEWLYRITKAVADDEKSSVLLANAIHHRSDAYSSLVALVAILGTWWFPSLPLDPIGGIIVSLVILRQGLAVLFGAWGDLTDASVSQKTRKSLIRILDPLLVSPASQSENSTVELLAIQQLRARRAGSMIFVDLTAEVSAKLTVRETTTLEEKITRALKDARREIAEVRVKFLPVDPSRT